MTLNENARYSAVKPVPRPCLILIAGPYLSGTGGDPSRVAQNLKELERYALPIYERGHLPMVGEWVALPIIQAAGGKAPGDRFFEQYQYPVAERLIELCDAVLRIPGASKGADLDVARARARGLPVYTKVEEIPRRRMGPSADGANGG
jgi:hypothetical protein